MLKEKTIIEKIKEISLKQNENYKITFDSIDNMIDSLKVLIENKSKYSTLLSFIMNYSKKFSNLKQNHENLKCFLKRC